MGLREQAELDLAMTMEDPVCGFGWPIVLTDPAGVSKPLTGLSTDIAQLIDPDTGETVSGRLASVALRIYSIESATPGPAFSLPEAVALNSSAPWRVAFDQPRGGDGDFGWQQHLLGRSFNLSARPSIDQRCCRFGDRGSLSRHPPCRGS